MSVGGEDDTIVNQRATVSGAALPDGVELVAGRYRILRWLGAGGMGRVYEAFDTELGERAALKVLRGGLTDEAIERFRREVKLTRRIRHHNVARMYDIGEHDRDKFLTMELVDGASLAHELGAAMPWPRLRTVAVQLCAGLAAAHAAGVIHRDLKPDNVMIERGTDFGLIDITWLDGCPLFSPLAPDLRWRVIRDEVAERAARVLGAFRSAAGR
ncbi:MAG TPA: protein kinase [Kofleriaceae bacterium]|nr:protein kinase [Kofleriaceae bacterium]